MLEIKAIDPIKYSTDLRPYETVDNLEYCFKLLMKEIVK